MWGRIVALCTGLLSLSPLEAQVPPSSYKIETVATPAGIASEVSAITFAADGRLFACFRLGSIWSLEPATGEWEPFASGLFWPLGIVPGKAGEFFVAQIPELTRVTDIDGDGRADLYETVCDRWGLSGNYHEFVAGPVRDSAGNFYIGLGCASNGGPIRPPVRGGLTGRKPRGKPYGHHSPVPYRGWIVKISPAGDMSPFCCGFRQPNGLVFDAAGHLFAADNQGDWVGTSALHHVTEGAFCGHPAGLVWDPTFSFPGHPQDAPVAELVARRKLPAIQFPQNDLAGSVAQPLFDTTRGKFGPFAGQLFVAEWSFPRIHRVALEEVGGEFQGACFPFVDGNGLRKGNNRLAFAPNGSLYVAQVSRLWGGSGEGLQRVVWSGEVPMDILTMRLRRDGFELTFTKPVDRRTAEDPAAYSLQQYYYLYHATYGSPKKEATAVSVGAARVSADARSVLLEIEELVEKRVYELRTRGLRAADGTPLSTRLAAYTLNRLKSE